MNRAVIPHHEPLSELDKLVNPSEFFHSILGSKVILFHSYLITSLLKDYTKLDIKHQRIGLIY
jgi:hypothetical protein